MKSEEETFPRLIQTGESPSSYLTWHHRPRDVSEACFGPSVGRRLGARSTYISVRPASNLPSTEGSGHAPLLQQSDACAEPSVDWRLGTGLSRSRVMLAPNLR